MNLLCNYGRSSKKESNPSGSENIQKLHHNNSEVACADSRNQGRHGDRVEGYDRRALDTIP